MIFFFPLAPFSVHWCSTVGNTVFFFYTWATRTNSPSYVDMMQCSEDEGAIKFESYFPRDQRCNLKRISREMNDTDQSYFPRNKLKTFFFPEKCSLTFGTRCGSWAHELSQNFQVSLLHRKNSPRRRKSRVNNPRLNKAFKLIPKSRLKQLGKSVCVVPCLYNISPPKSVLIRLCFSTQQLNFSSRNSSLGPNTHFCSLLYTYLPSN